MGSRRVARFTWFPPWSWYRAGPQAGSVNGVLMVLGSQAAPKLSWRDGGCFPACLLPLPSEHSSELAFWLGPRMAWSSEPAPPEGPGGTAGPQWGLGGSRRQRSLNCWHLQALIHPGCLTPSPTAPPPRLPSSPPSRDCRDCPLLQSFQVAPGTLGTPSFLHYIPAWGEGEAGPQLPGLKEPSQNRSGS